MPEGAEYFVNEPVHNFFDRFEDDVRHAVGPRSKDPTRTNHPEYLGKERLTNKPMERRCHCHEIY